MKRQELDELYKGIIKVPKIPRYVAPKSNAPPMQIPTFGEMDPISFEEYIGQEKAKKVIQVFIKAAHKEERLLPNILFTGSAGLGKTTLAKLSLKSVPCIFIDGNTVNSTHSELFGYVIIDEIHNVKPDVCDTLNVLLDSGRINVLACTTNPGSIPKALRSRFRTVTLFPYTVEDLTQILKGVMERKGKPYISDEFLQAIALRSRNTPRRALQYLSFILDVMSINNQKELDAATLAESFEMIGVDEQGLLEIDYRYLAAFPDNWNRSVGLQYLSAVTGVDKETLEEDVEPYLMQLKLIDRTPKGRKKL